MVSELPEQTKPIDVVAKAQEKEVRVRPFKKLFQVLIIAVPLLAIIGYFSYTLYLKFFTKPPETPLVAESEDGKVINTQKIYSYKVQLPQLDPVASFIYFGDATSLFSPFNVYYLTKENRLLATPFFVSAINSAGRPWCFGQGKDPLTVSLSQDSFVCFENISNKDVIVRRLDLKGREYKEYFFSSKREIFGDSKFSRVVVSRDADAALIYSTAGAFIFESKTGTLNKIDLPGNLEIIKAVSLSNTESALITANNKIYRVNFSSNAGGIFDINFISLSNEQLASGLPTARLSKDGRRIIFTISSPIEEISGEPNYQSVIAYNIDLVTAKLSDELNYDEKFLVSCKNLSANKYCFYKSITGEAGSKTEVVYMKEYDLPLTEVVKAKAKEDKEFRIILNLIPANGNYIVLKAPSFFVDPRDNNIFTWVVYTYNIQKKELKPLTY